MGIFDKLKGKSASPVEAEPEPVTIDVKVPRVPDPSELIETTEGAKVYFPKEGDEPNWTINETFNLTEKMVKVDVPFRIRVEGVPLEAGKDYYTEKDIYLWEEDGLIRAMKGQKVIFEVTKRSKAYKEMLKYARRKASRLSIWEEVGDYGKYYRARLHFDIVMYKW